MDKKRLTEKFEALRLAVKWTYNSSPFLSIVSIILFAFGALVNIVEPYMFKIIIDKITTADKIATLQTATTIGIGILGAFIAYGLARMAKNVFWDVNQLIGRTHKYRIESYSMHKLMEHIATLDLAYFENSEYYNTLNQANMGIWRIMNVFSEVGYFFYELLTIIIIISIFGSVNWWLVLLVVLGAIPSIMIAIGFAEVIWSAFNESSPIFRHAHYYRTLLTEQPEAIKEIKSFGLKEHFLKKFKNLFIKFIKNQDTAALAQLRWYIVIGIVEGGASVFAAWLVIQSYLQGKITIGEVTFLWTLLFQFAEHARWLVRMIGDMNTDATFLTPLVKVMGFKSTIAESQMPKKFPVSIKKGIELQNVSFYYPNQKKASLKDVNLIIKPNENIALVGENGSGKTTLIKLLCRLYDVSSGEILIDGINIKDYKLDDLYHNLGVIFQDFMKYEALVEENIKFGRLSNKGKDKVHEAAVKAGAWDFIKRLESTYKAHIGKKLKDEGVDLSIGQWQKIALARAFFRDAQILILDEPTAAVDAKAEYELFRKFKKLTSGKITFLISHRFSTVRMADRIIVIDKGKIIEIGTHDELMKKNGHYAKLFNLQAKGYK